MNKSKRNREGEGDRYEEEKKHNRAKEEGEK
jgi:hypothetical protein